jgi:uncharacterized alpha-E superfamily protein
MLARNAESLYWIGRYGERADDTARILDVSVHQLLEDATIDVDAAARRLLDVIRDVGEAVSLQFFHAAPWVAWTAPEVV